VVDHVGDEAVTDAHRRARDDLREAIVGYRVASAIRAAVELGLPSAVPDAGIPLGVLADRVGAPVDSMTRLVRALAAVGVFALDDAGIVHRTPGSEVLDPTHPATLHDTVLLLTREHYDVWGRLTDAVRTGRPQWSAVFGGTYFDYAAETPDFARVLGTANDEGAAALADELHTTLVSRDVLAPSGRIVDVAGGTGYLLWELLHRSPDASGVLVERPEAAPIPIPDDLADRAGVVYRDMFADPLPRESDLYVIKHVLHNWPDADVLVVLRSVAAAMGPDSRLAIVERLPDEHRPTAREALSDLHMLVTLGGRSRTAEAFRALLADAGLRVESVTRLAAGPSLLLATRPSEADPALTA
jgi:hypothetical protein